MWICVYIYVYIFSISIFIYAFIYVCTYVYIYICMYNSLYASFFDETHDDVFEILMAAAVPPRRHCKALLSCGFSANFGIKVSPGKPRNKLPYLHIVTITFIETRWCESIWRTSGAEGACTSGWTSALRRTNQSSMAGIGRDATTRRPANNANTQCKHT